MAYFKDFTDYRYHSSGVRPQTKNIGWLQRGVEFELAVASQEILNCLLAYCKISIVQTRGLHLCDLCGSSQPVRVDESDVRLLLGGAEIRVFSNEGAVYAAPNLIYHYVRCHHYKLPEKFVEAIVASPCPPSPVYFEQLKKLKLEWNQTLPGIATAAHAGK